MQNAARQREPDRSMAEAERMLQNARTSFLLANSAKSEADIARYAAIGRDYLGLAHRAARIEGRPSPRMSDLP
jgi:hypothetical protein